ncbi:hypothetical protein BDV95DRAFT_482066 [Massariosphaeria phaeospora]|uniref:DUF221-domain-containing protein n=1 Tax=Massariosphaeria phaeospora TaxID=100035 RepID=A0A7C8IGB9_9PLEO|nr:hypothetical protein BDV95DRAFT_482066 [Massariosphaeria phaeospora]
MSAPSSDGRPSISSDPSVTSSSTLHAGYVGAYEDNGEGSSAQRQSEAGSRPDSGARARTPEAASRRPGSPLMGEAIHEQDFAERRHRNRNSGGFLLDSTFSGGPKTRYSHAHVEHPKSKRSSRHLHDHTVNGQQGRLRTRDGLLSSNSPLSRELRPTDQDTADRTSRAGPADQSQQAMPRQTIDPNQIVHMALNLSESRRRNLSAGQLLIPQPQAPSAVRQQDGNFRNYSADSSLRQYLNEQRRTSRHISPAGGRTTPSGSRQSSTSMVRSGSLPLQGGGQANISPGTIARRDKARAYIELGIEYLRLLDFLPPLKPDSSAPGNFTFTASNMPGSPHAQLTRVPSYAGKQHEFGRAYNPLQLIRNRRGRARERKGLDHAPEEFLDTDSVREWIDRVEMQAQAEHYRHQDGVSLPKFHDDHQREDVFSKPGRLRMGWSFTPQELLADAHWLEQGDNKALAEDRYGRKIFPSKEPQKQDLLQPRASKDHPEKRRKSWVDGLPGLSTDPATGDESEPTSERGRKRRLLPAFRAESPKHKKHGRKGARPLSSVYAESSGSDSDSRKPGSMVDVNDNTGPLALKVKEMMEEEARKAESRSPAIISPDTPDKWGRDHPDTVDERTSRISHESSRPANGSVGLGSNHSSLKLPPKIRTNPTLSLDLDREPRISLDDLDSTAPNTPLHTKKFPHIGVDLSPPRSREPSTTRKPKKSRLDFFRSHDINKAHRHEHKYEQDLAGSDKTRAPERHSEEIVEGNGLGTALFAAPSAVKSLLTHRRNESVSSLHSPSREYRKDTKEYPEPSSAVTRFFKGVKNERHKVGGFVFGKDRSADDSDTDSASIHQTPNESDTDEDDIKADRKVRPGAIRSVTTGSVTTKKNGRYHLELPTFRSANPAQADDNEVNATDADHPITRQSRARANSRSARFDKLAPPRMDLTSISGKSNGDVSYPLSPSRSQDQMSKVLARPGRPSGGLPMTSLANPQLDNNREHRNSRPTLEGSRHWSIADDDDNNLHLKNTPKIVTASDIARIRALFICSGVKASEIARRAHSRRANPAGFLTRAAKAARVELFPVARKEEHVLAARILVRNLETSTQALHTSTEQFQTATVKDITSKINTLRSRVESELFPQVLNSGDEAVRITSDVSSSAPLAVKQLSDEIDKMIRARKRRLRWAKRSSLPTASCSPGHDVDRSLPQGGSSLASVVSAFVPTWSTAVLFVAVFVVVRQRYPKIYTPRTFIGTIPEKDHTPSASRSYFAWMNTMRHVPDKFVLNHVSLDSYLFLRFLRTIIFICVVGCCLTWPILIPINATGGGASSQLDMISIGNVVDKKHLYAHATIAWVFFSFIMFTVARERLWLIGLRQAWNLSKPNANRLSSRTVLFLSAPQAALDEDNTQRYFGNDAVRLWPATKAEKLESLVSSRNSLVDKLETAEIDLIQNANKTNRDGRKKTIGRNGDSTQHYDSLPEDLRKTLRPTHRLPIERGRKVDSIEYYRDQIKEKESEIEQARQSNANAEQQGSSAVFVEFKTQSAAQQACQQVTSKDLLSLNPRYTGVMPSEIIWDNVTLPPARRISQEGVAYAVVIATIVFWSIPVAFVGAFSNVSYLARKYEWLSFLNNLPQPVMGLLTGLVPPLLLSLLSAYVPNIFRYIFKTFGEPTNTSAEIKVLKWFYVFQVTQVFLVNTISSGAAAVISEITSSPSAVPTLLAQNLPKAANSYLTYFIVQGLTSSSNNLLNHSDLLSFIGLGYLFDKTPRQKYNRYTSLKGLAWGKVFPKYANFAIIAIVYSCIAPLVLGFAAVGLCLFYFSYRYMLLFTVQPKIDTKGHCYTLALQQILTGVYIAELCLLGLFSLNGATGPAIMLAVLLACTVLYNITTNKYFSPLETYLPADLAVESEDEQAPLLSAAEEGEAHSASHIHRLGTQARVPQQVIDPLARFFEPHVYASYKVMKAWLDDGDFDDAAVPQYTEDALKKAYLNPAFTSATPLVWLARDEMGVSKHEVWELEAGGFKCSDEGAWIDKDGRLRWNERDFGEVPVFREGVKW